MILNIHDTWKRANEGSFDPVASLPLPDYTHISSAIDIWPARQIKFKDIYITDDVDQGNAAREHGQDPGHISNLVESFADGVDTTQPVGAVKQQAKNSPTPYKLMYGFGRSLAQMELGLEGWFFNVIKADQTEWENIQSFENEDHLPKVSNSERDIIQIKVKQVREGRLANNENIIEADLKKIYPRRKKTSRDRIASAIYKATGTSIRYSYYTNAKISLWRDNHASEWFAIDGNLHDEKGEYGFTSKIGGLYRTWHRAIKKYADEGKKSYVNCFTGTIGENTSLESQRMSIIDEYIRLRVRYALIYHTDIKFLRLNGFFPQATQVDNWKAFVPVDLEKIETEIKARINNKAEMPSTSALFA